MADGFLSTNDLAKRWNLRPGTLSRWRQHGTGPAFLKSGKAVRYRIEDVIEYEKCSLQIPPPTNRAEIAIVDTTAEPSQVAPKLSIRMSLPGSASV